MINNEYDLSVAYRIYPKISAKPPVFNNNKFKLSELCLKSFIESLGSLKVKIWVLLDNCPLKYEKLFKKYFNEDDLEIIKLKGIGNDNTFALQLKILSEQKDSEIVYFAEDDYFYFKNKFRKMISFLKNNSDVHFVTPYDHLDHYTHFYHDYKSFIKVFANKHWRTIHSTCCTFLTTKSILKKTKKVFEIYLQDTTILLTSWACLTKYNVFKIFKIIKYFFNNKIFFIFLYKAWRYGWKQILFGRSWNLWCPIPTIATHMVYNCLPPTFNWENIFKKAIKDFSL